MGYEPKPADTSGVALPEEILSVMEDIARNTHEVWAKGRMDAGWVHGDVYDGEKKTHPRLVPYERLPESEKEYDRHTSSQVIKMILHMGFRIRRE